MSSTASPTPTAVDPLDALPGEVTLQICLHCNIRSLLRLEAVSQSWKRFLETHGAYLWSHKAAQIEHLTAGSSSSRPSRHLSRPGVSDAHTHADDLQKVLRGKWSCDLDGWSGVETWKEYCRRQFLLNRNLASPEAEMYDRCIDTGEVIVWRMRPDYEQRLLVCTAHNGGLWVYDMDTGRLLWNRSQEEVGPHTHLEHSQGTLAYNPGEGETIEIWRRADLVVGAGAGGGANAEAGASSSPPSSYKRGEFLPIGRLPHSLELRGWHLLYPHLCVVSNHGKAWVYDVSVTPPKLSTTIELDNGARGHLDQDETSVLFCMKQKGYHVYDKATGAKLGELDPASWGLYDEHDGDVLPNIFHIIHPDPAPSALLGACELKDHIATASGNTTAVELRRGPLRTWSRTTLDNAEWGAGMVSGPYFVGVSRGGKVLILSDWKAVLKDPSTAKKYAAVIECDGDTGAHYDMGGWLTLGGAHGNQRAAWEVRDRVYLFPLPAPGTLPTVTTPSGEAHSGHRDDDDATKADTDIVTDSLPIHAIPSTSDAQLPVPISFMQLTEDHLLTTYASIQIGPPSSSRAQEREDGTPPPRLYMAKTPRFAHFSPWVNSKMKLRAEEEAKSLSKRTRGMMHAGYLAAASDLYDSDENMEDSDDDGDDDDDAPMEFAPLTHGDEEEVDQQLIRDLMREEQEHPDVEGDVEDDASAAAAETDPAVEDGELFLTLNRVRTRNQERAEAEAEAEARR